METENPFHTAKECTCREDFKIPGYMHDQQCPIHGKEAQPGECPGRCAEDFDCLHPATSVQPHHKDADGSPCHHAPSLEDAAGSEGPVDVAREIYSLYQTPELGQIARLIAEYVERETAELTADVTEWGDVAACYARERDALQEKLRVAREGLMKCADVDTHPVEQQRIARKALAATEDKP